MGTEPPASARGATPRCEVVAVADLAHARHDRVAELAPGSRFTTDPASLLEDGAIDAVVIATSARSHASLAAAALRAGKHVLVEKPLALSLSDALAVTEIADRSDRVAMVGHLMVFHPAVRRLRTLLQSGSLGRPYYLHSTRVNLGRLRHDETAL